MDHKINTLLLLSCLLTCWPAWTCLRNLLTAFEDWHEPFDINHSDTTPLISRTGRRPFFPYSGQLHATPPNHNRSDEVVYRVIQHSGWYDLYAMAHVKMPLERNDWFSLSGAVFIYRLTSPLFYSSGSTCQMPDYYQQDCHYFYRSALRLLNVPTAVAPIYCWPWYLQVLEDSHILSRWMNPW